MGNLTIGKITIVVWITLLLSNSTIYFLENGNPFKKVPDKSFWTLFTGLSIALTIMALIGILIFWIVENWNKKIF